MSKILSWALVVLCMALIFRLSSQPAVKSDRLSMGITNVIIKTVEKVTPNHRLNPRSFNHIVRKNAHFFAYLLLGFLAINALSRSNARDWLSIVLAVLLCILYAASDEIHQIFVAGRGPEVRDVLLDSMGAGFGICLYLLIGISVKIDDKREV